MSELFLAVVCCILVAMVVYIAIMYWPLIEDLVDMSTLKISVDNDTTIKVYQFKGKLPGPMIYIIAGVHGNEPAGTVALETMINDNTTFNLTRGTVRVIPRANPWGLDNNSRYQNSWWYPDLNRNFATNDKVAQALLKLLDDADMVIDFHEGWGYYRDKLGSVGSTVSPTPDRKATALAQNITQALNDTIPPGRKQFTVLKNLYCDIAGTLSCAMYKKLKPYVLIETTGQDNVQPLETRTTQVKTAVLVGISELRQ